MKFSYTSFFNIFLSHFRIDQLICFFFFGSICSIKWSLCFPSVISFGAAVIMLPHYYFILLLSHGPLHSLIGSLRWHLFPLLLHDSSAEPNERFKYLSGATRLLYRPPHDPHLRCQLLQVEPTSGPRAPAPPRWAAAPTHRGLISLSIHPEMSVTRTSRITSKYYTRFVWLSV